MRLLFLFAALWAAAQSRESLEKQLKSVQQQRDSLRKMGLSPVHPMATCEPLTEVDLASLIDRAAQVQQLPPKLIRAVIEQESGFAPCAESDRGAQGLMQLMPATAAQQHLDDPFDPAANVLAGTAYLRRLLEKYKGDLDQALAAYNAGPEAVEKSAGVPDITQTRNYVAAIEEKFGAKHVELPPVAPPP